MTDPLTQAQADAEQARLVREALALRREHPAGQDSPPVLRFFPGGPRPTLAEASGRSQGAPLPAAVAQPGLQEPMSLYRRSRRAEGGRTGGKPALR